MRYNLEQHACIRRHTWHNHPQLCKDFMIRAACQLSKPVMVRHMRVERCAFVYAQVGSSARR